MDTEDLAPTIEVTFKVSCDNSPGTSLWLLGNVQKLGNWDLKRAIRLQFSGSIYSMWESPSLALPTGTPLEYKFIQKTDSGVVWESLPGEVNHSLTLGFEDEVEVIGTFGRLQKQVEVAGEESSFRDALVHATDDDVVIYVSQMLPFTLYKEDDKYIFTASRVNVI